MCPGPMPRGAGKAGRRGKGRGTLPWNLFHDACYVPIPSPEQNDRRL